jgi:plastocyanin
MLTRPGLVSLDPARRARSRARRLGRALALLALAGCGTDAVAPTPIADPSALYWALTLDRRAITISTVAPYDTIRLAATPYNALGDAIADAPAITYRSTDPERIQVDSAGLVHALETGFGIQVIASLTLGPLTHADTATINVTNVSSPPVLDTFSIHPVPPDSAVWFANALSFTDFYGPKPVPYVALDTNGAPVPNLVVEYRSSDTTIATVDQFGLLLGVRPGIVKVTATTTAYGITKADTVPYAITMPTGQVVFIQKTTTPGAPPIMFTPSQVTIAVGGRIIWFNTTGSNADVTFDDPTNVAEDFMCGCGSGNIPAFGDTTGVGFSFPQYRIFTAAGRYPYHDTITGASGEIVVEAPPAEVRRAR